MGSMRNCLCSRDRRKIEPSSDLCPIQYRPERRGGGRWLTNGRNIKHTILPWYYHWRSELGPFISFMDGTGPSTICSVSPPERYGHLPSPQLTLINHEGCFIVSWARATAGAHFFFHFIYLRFSEIYFYTKKKNHHRHQ